MSSVQVLCVVGARPNFVKIAPIMRALAQKDIFRCKLVHTGQHYDVLMNDIFFSGTRHPDAGHPPRRWVG
jgi:UDP-N-acetylglucosamine 2-epimerase (non-hydrolysing)